MGPNDTDVVRVFTTNAGGGIGDVTFEVGAGAPDFEVRVDAEAGSAVFAGGPQFRTSIVLRDITQNDDIPFAPADFSGNVNSAAWPTAAHTFVYTVTASGLAGRENHICEARAFVVVGITDQDASFATSPTFLLTGP